MTSLGIQWLDRIERERHDYVTEMETERANKARELQAANELLEAVRHNESVEAENLRHNMEMESENLRSHLADEALRHEAYLENVRHNFADEFTKRRANEINAQKNNITAAFNAAKVTDMKRARELESERNEVESRKVGVQEFKMIPEVVAMSARAFSDTAKGIATIAPLVVAAFG